MIEIDQMTQGETASSNRIAFTGLTALAAATTMLLAALTSAYIVRRGLAGDWEPLHLPSALAGSVILFLLSSLALEMGRRSFALRKRRGFVGLWFAGVGFGILFLLTQAYDWRQISQMGISAATSPAAAFFYLLTGTVMVFVIGALAALILIGVCADYANPKASLTRLKIAAYYWHYLDGLFIYLVLLLYLRS